MTPSAFDVHMMTVALAMARRGLGMTSPNPSVGAVIADEAAGEVISRGSTQPGGRPHAETEAIRRAGVRARGATMYVTLEPCAHHGVTPPCADAIVAAGLARVVVGADDPDPRTAGAGIGRLRQMGVRVERGVLAEATHRMALGHMLRVTERRPFVQAKLALDASGCIARASGGRPVWVTGPEARAMGHLLRAEADAVLVGARTVAEDDPELTCRLPGLLKRSPLRIVMTRELGIDPGSRLVRSAGEVPTLVISGPAPSPARRAVLAQAGVSLVEVATGETGPEIPGVLQVLADRGITRLLVEGGPGMWRAFASAGVVDEAHLFHAGAGTAEGLIGRWLPGAELRLADRRRIGDDLHLVYSRG